MTKGKTLVILESPGKIKKVQGILGNSYIVKASIGHIRNLRKKDGVDKENGFEPIYEISDDKKDVVKDIIETYKKCDDIIILTDMDLEGEQIGYSICKILKIDPLKTKRCITAEITEKGIKNAIANPGVINMDKIYAQQTRRVVDRLCGYDLSGLVISKIQPGLSAGRVQSVATRIITDREAEINKFTSNTDFKIIGLFETKDKNNKIQNFKGVLNKRFNEKDQVKKFLESLIGAEYTVKNIQTKPSKSSPPGPFTTSTIQQEASRKFGYNVDKTMQICQKLYENGHCSYMRTDSLTMSAEAMDAAKEQIINSFGENYSNPKQYKSKSENSAHECLRPTHFENQTIQGTDEEKRMYELIWKRTVASQMMDAKFDKTTAVISSNKTKEEFVAKGQVETFPGFLKLYNEGNDEEESEENDSATLPEMKPGQKIVGVEIQGNEIYSKPAARYTQASLVKKMEELGIGKSSTYASIIKTIMDRGYVEIKNLPAQKREVTNYKLKGAKIEEEIRMENFGAEAKKMFPTDIGKVLTEYLVQTFPEILDYKFTAGIEKQMDDIEAGKKIWNKFIEEFYTPFSEAVKKAKGNTDRPGGKDLGIDPASGLPVSARIARFGPVIQLGVAVKQEKGAEKAKSDIRFVKIPENMSIDTITLEEALELLKWPRQLGEWKGETITAAIGKFGPYVKYGSVFASITIPPEKITLEEAIEVIKQKEEGGGGGGAIQDFGNIKVLKGQYGPYIKDVKKKKNYKIPTHLTAETITEDECLEIIGEAKTAPKKKAWGGKTKKKK